MDIDYNSKEYKRCRTAYATQCTLEHMLGLLVADAFLAKLLSYIGLSDALVGIITSFTSVACIFQLLSIFLVQSSFSTKKTVIFSDVLSQLFFVFVYFVPFTPIPEDVKKILVMVLVMLAQAGKSIISSLYFKWANTYVSPEKRSTFSAMKECISLLCGIIFSAFMGHFIDKYESIGNIKGGFLFIASSMLIINIINFISLILIKDEKRQAREEMKVPLKEVLCYIYKNKIFFHFLLTGFILNISTGILTGFLGIYKTKDLAMSVFTVQIINIAADFFRMGVSMPFAKYSKKKGYAKGIQTANILVALSYITVIFTTPNTKWLIVLYSLLYTASMAGSYQNSFNIGYTLLPQKYMTQALSLKNAFGGVITFLSAIFAGKILSIIQAGGNTLFGIHIYGQQVLAFIALILIIPAIILQYKYVVKPLEGVKKEL